MKKPRGDWDRTREAVNKAWLLMREASDVLDTVLDSPDRVCLVYADELENALGEALTFLGKEDDFQICYGEAVDDFAD